MYENQLFFKNNFKNIKITALFSQAHLLYYTALHIKLSSLVFKTQLVDIFSYENLTTEINNTQFNSKLKNSKNIFIIFYNFHNFFNEERLLLGFSTNSKKKNKSTNNLDLLFKIKSITELFFTAWWLEREISELYGIYFLNKKDTRNLMLTYGDTTFPFKKIFPSVGLKEIYYDTTSDSLIYNSISLQF